MENIRSSKFKYKKKKKSNPIYLKQKIQQYDKMEM